MNARRLPIVLVMSLPVLFGFSMPSCGPKKAECEALTNAMKEARAAFGEEKGGKDDFKAMAKKYKAAQEKVEAVKVTVPELKSFRDKYAEHIGHLATAADITAKVTGGEITDPAELDKAKAKAKKSLDAVDQGSEMDLYIDTLKFCGD
jgi:hypothetical protein